MGYRTLVILYNDQAHEWQKDAKLGQKIAEAMNHIPERSSVSPTGADLGYGRVVECSHADTQTLAVVDSYNFTPIAHDSWASNESRESIAFKLVKAAADKLGFRLVKKTVKS